MDDCNVGSQFGGTNLDRNLEIYFGLALDISYSGVHIKPTHLVFKGENDDKPIAKVDGEHLGSSASCYPCAKVRVHANGFKNEVCPSKNKHMTTTHNWVNWLLL